MKTLTQLNNFYIKVIMSEFLGWLVGWFLWHINLCRLFNAKLCLYVYTFNLRFLNEYFDRIFG